MHWLVITPICDNCWLNNIYCLAHQQAFTIRILHQDVSPRNIMIKRQSYWIDRKFAKSTSVKCPCQVTHTMHLTYAFTTVLPKEHFQSTWQFMSACLMEDTTILHRVQDNMELVFWVLLWMVLMFSLSSLMLETCTIFVRDTFKSVPGVDSKWGVLVSQMIESTLLSGWESLYKLLKALTNLFKYFYHWPDAECALLEQHEPLEDQPVEMQTVMRAIPVYLNQESKQWLWNHEHIISLFSAHLQMDWPADDAAKEQKLTGTDCFGVELGKLTVLRAKHVLESVVEEWRQKRCRTACMHMIVFESDDPYLVD